MQIERKKVVFLFILIMVLFALSISDGIHTIKNIDSPKISTLIYDRDGKILYESISGLSGYRSNDKLSEIPQYCVDAVISSEDKRFYKHPGFDLLAIVRSMLNNVFSGDVVSGASTITQQYTKKYLKSDNVLFHNKYIKKIREINSSVYVELAFKKYEILEKYINSVYFGNSAYGFGSSARVYFGKPLDQISLSECALLAGSIKNPSILYDEKNIVEVKNDILSKMYRNKYIDKETLDVALLAPLNLSYESRPENYMHMIDYALEESMRLVDAANTEDLAGYSIHTTVDTNISELGLRNAVDQVNLLREKNKISNAAVVVIDVESGDILSMIGGIAYSRDIPSSTINMTIVPRQPGSALKPITYATAFSKKILTPDSIIQDEKTVFTDSKGDSYVPYNYNGIFNGPVSARVALASSLNVPAVKVLQLVGVSDMVDTAHKMGITTLKDPSRYDLSVTLGGGEVSLLDLTNVYATLSRGGLYLKPTIIDKIVDSHGGIVYSKPDFEPKEVWGLDSTYVSKTIFSILSDNNAKVLGFGRGNALNMDFPCASKTGTTTDWHDNWTLGYTTGHEHDFAVGVWVGNNDNSPMIDIDGVTGAGPIWREITAYTYKYLNQDEKKVFSPNSTPNEPDNLITAFDTHEASEQTSYVYARITNPSNKSRYYLLHEDSPFEKILLEVLADDVVVRVDFLVDGIAIGKIYGKNIFKTLWSPIEGSHIVKAICYNESGQEIYQTSSIFSVTEQE